MNNYLNTVINFFSAPVFEGDEAKTRRARLLHVILSLQAYTVIAAFLGTLYTMFSGGEGQLVSLIVLISSFLFIMFWRFLMRRGNVSIASAGLIIAFTVLIAIAIAATGTIQSSATVFFPLAIVMAVLLIGKRAGIIAFGAVSLIGIVIAQLEISGSLPASSTTTNIISVAITLVSGMGLALVLLYLATQGIEDALQRAQEKELEVRELANTLEQRVADRTKDMATVAEVGIATATILNVNQLLQEVVDITKERFNLYHSHIYLLDEAGKNLVLASGADEAGRQMVAEKRSIPLDREQSLVARAARERQGVTVNDVTAAPDFLANPLLPDTRSELAVPMIIGGSLIGVFDVQSDQIGRFGEADINIQTTMAAQIATSIQNLRSFEQSKSQADLESLVNSIGQKIQKASTVEETLQTAIRELGLTLGASRVKANLSTKNQYGSDTAGMN